MLSPDLLVIHTDPKQDSAIIYSSPVIRMLDLICELNDNMLKVFQYREGPALMA